MRRAEPTAEASGAADAQSSAVVSHLFVVDLAGSERLSSSGNGATAAMPTPRAPTPTATPRGQQRKQADVISEAVSINKSLFNLQRVVRLLSSSTGKGAAATEHIPYRDSKLTWLLRPALSGRFYANFICCITPAHEHYYQTRSTIAFAMRAKEIKYDEALGEWDRRKAEALKERLPHEQAKLKAMWDRICVPDAERRRCAAAFSLDASQAALQAVLLEQERIAPRCAARARALRNESVHAERVSANAAHVRTERVSANGVCKRERSV